MTLDFDTNKVIKLFQGLSFLIDSDDDDCSSCSGIGSPIQNHVDDLKLAIAKFALGIGEYMHKTNRDVSELPIVKMIIEECPEFIIMQDRAGNLPIHAAAVDQSSCSTFVPLLAMAGANHGIKEGGLTLLNSQHCHALGNIVRKGNQEAILKLFNTRPRLLTENSVIQYRLLHHAARNGHPNLNIIKMLVRQNPRALFEEVNYKGDLPIYASCWRNGSIEITELLLQSAIQHDPGNPNIGGLFASKANRKMVIDKMIEHYGSENSWKCIQRVLSQFKSIPILHHSILSATKHVEQITKFLPHACLLRDKDERLPIHLALASGMKSSPKLTSIIHCNLQFIGESDPVTMQCASQLAASEPSCDKMTIGYLVVIEKSFEGTKEPERKRQKLIP